MKGRGSAVSRARAGFAILLITVAAAGVYYVESSSNSATKGLSMREADPITHAGSFVPANLTTFLGTHLTLTLNNTYSESRSFSIDALNVSVTVPGHSVKSLGLGSMDKVGVFKYVSSIQNDSGTTAPLVGYLFVICPPNSFSPSC